MVQSLLVLSHLGIVRFESVFSPGGFIWMFPSGLEEEHKVWLPPVRLCYDTVIYHDLGTHL